MGRGTWRRMRERAGSGGVIKRGRERKEGDITD